MEKGQKLLVYGRFSALDIHEDVLKRLEVLVCLVRICHVHSERAEHPHRRGLGPCLTSKLVRVAAPFFLFALVLANDLVPGRGLLWFAEGGRGEGGIEEGRKGRREEGREGGRGEGG